MIKGLIYSEEKSTEYQIDIKHKFHDDEETFEVYECPECHCHFLVEADALESMVFCCPYCMTKFEEDE